MPDFFTVPPDQAALEKQKQLNVDRAALEATRAARNQPSTQDIINMLTEKYSMPLEQAQAVAADLSSPSAPVSGGLSAGTIRQEAGEFAVDALARRAEEETGRLKQMTLRAKAFKDIHARLKAGEEVSPADRSFYEELVAPHRAQMVAAGRNALATRQANTQDVMPANPGSSLADLAASVYGAPGAAVGAVAQEGRRKEMLAAQTLATQEGSRARILTDQAKLARGEPAEYYLAPDGKVQTAGYVPSLIGEGAGAGISSLADLATSVYGK